MRDGRERGGGGAWETGRRGKPSGAGSGEKRGGGGEGGRGEGRGQGEAGGGRRRGAGRGPGAGRHRTAAALASRVEGGSVSEERRRAPARGPLRTPTSTSQLRDHTPVARPRRRPRLRSGPPHRWSVEGHVFFRLLAPRPGPTRRVGTKSAPAARCESENTSRKTGVVEGIFTGVNPVLVGRPGDYKGGKRLPRRAQPSASLSGPSLGLEEGVRSGSRPTRVPARGRRGRAHVTGPAETRPRYHISLPSSRPPQIPFPQN